MIHLKESIHELNHGHLKFYDSDSNSILILNQFKFRIDSCEEIDYFSRNDSKFESIHCKRIDSYGVVYTTGIVSSILNQFIFRINSGERIDSLCRIDSKKESILGNSDSDSQKSGIITSLVPARCPPGARPHRHPTQLNGPVSNTRRYYKAVLRFGEYSCCCLSFLPHLACSILATWERP